MAHPGWQFGGPGRGMPREVIVEMRDRLIAGETWPVIADALGISVRSIARTLKEAGGMPPRWTDRPTCQLSLADREYVFAIYLDQPAPYPPVMMLPDGSGTLAAVSMRAPDEAAAALPTVRQAAADDWQRWLLAPRRDEIDAGIGFVATDQSVLDRLAGQHYATLDAVQVAVIDALKNDLPAAEAGEPRFSAEVLNGNLVGPVIMVTKPKHDDPVIIASVWFVEVSGTAPDLTVKTVTTSYRCRGGQLRQPGYECV